MHEDDQLARTTFRGRFVRTMVGALSLATAALVCLAVGQPAVAAKLDDLPLERWKELREVERYQLNIAESYYNKQDWKVALAEYEKFLTLYEMSTGASYAQLKWGVCQVNLRKPNTAIKEGFQTVIDYWPESPEAIAAAYFIGNAYKDMGEVVKAKKAYRTVMDQHGEHLVAVMSAVNLIDISTIENDTKARLALWRKLVFETKRTADSHAYCQEASRNLAVHSFATGQFDEGIKSLATTYNDVQMPGQIYQYSQQTITTLTGDAKTKAQGDKLAEQAINYIKARVPTDITKPEAKNQAKAFWFVIADLYSVGRLPEKVPEVYEQMVTKYGSADDILGRLAGWYRAQNQPDKARDTYLRYENKFEGQNLIAQMYISLQKYDQAVLIYRQLAIQDVPNAVNWTKLIASTYFTAKQYKEAIGVYEELVTLDPNNADSTWRFSIGYAYHHMGSYKEAIGNYRQATNIPTNYLHMASCHRALKEPKEAILLYNQVMTSNPERAPEMLVEIAQTYEQAGQPEAAIKAFQQVGRKYPKSSQASFANTRLENQYKIIITKGGTTDE